MALSLHGLAEVAKTIQFALMNVAMVKSLAVLKK